MTQGYNNDQFFGLGGTGNGGNGAEQDDGRAAGQYSMAAKSNPDFLYPGRGLRVGDKTLLMDRGYIRTLLSTSQGEHMNIRKCGFQFNPSELNTNVKMSSNVYNAMLLDPVQITQPLLGSTNFIFTLFFDRSAEMSQGTTPTGTLASTNKNLFTTLDPSEIGVLRDIGELNAIIGSGLSPETQKLAEANLIKQINADSSIKNETDPAIKADTIKRLNASVQNIVGSGANLNFGNSAFLIPQPVRAVFSALFMVEGYVNSIDIRYLKFSTSMVPMQAQVTLSMEAVYVGYAKRKTFMIDQLDKAEEQYLAEQNALSSQAQALASQISSAFPSLGVITTENEPFSFSNDQPAHIGSIITGTPYSIAFNGGEIDLTKITDAGDGTAPVFSVTADQSIYGPYANITDTKTLSANKGITRTLVTKTGESLTRIKTYMLPSPLVKASSPTTNILGQYFITLVSVKVVATAGKDIVVTGTGSYRMETNNINAAGTGSGDLLKFEIPIKWVSNALSFVPEGGTIKIGGVTVTLPPTNTTTPPGGTVDIPPPATVSTSKWVRPVGYRGADVAGAW